MRRFLPIVAAQLLVCSSLGAQKSPSLLGLGESIGEGVQSVDAAIQTQDHGCLNLIAGQMGVEFPPPLIVTGPFGRDRSTHAAPAGVMSVTRSINSFRVFPSTTRTAVSQ